MSTKPALKITPPSNNGIRTPPQSRMRMPRPDSSFARSPKPVRIPYVEPAPVRTLPTAQPTTPVVTQPAAFPAKMAFGRFLPWVGTALQLYFLSRDVERVAEEAPRQVEWLPGPLLTPEQWKDRDEVTRIIEKRFGHLTTGALEQLKWIRTIQSRPYNAMKDPEDRHLFVADANGNYIQIPLDGQFTGYLQLLDSTRNGANPVSKRAQDELVLIEIDLTRRSWDKVEAPEEVSPHDQEIAALETEIRRLKADGKFSEASIKQSQLEHLRSLAESLRDKAKPTEQWERRPAIRASASAAESPAAAPASPAPTADPEAPAHAPSPNDGPENYRSTLLHPVHIDGSQSPIPIVPGISDTPVERNPTPNPNAPRILFISLFPLHSNGSGIYTQAMVDAVQKSGGDARVVVLSNGYGRSSVPKYIVPHTNTNPGRSNLDGAASAGVPFFDGNSAVTGKPFATMTDAEIEAYVNNLSDAVSTAARDFRPDVIVVNHAWMGVEAARRTGLPYIVVVHGTDINAIDQILKPNSTYPQVFADIAISGTRSAAKIIGVSGAIRERSVPLFRIRGDQSMVIYNGYDADIFFPRPEITRLSMLEYFGIQPEGVTHVVAYAGRMAAIKGVETGISAAQIVADALPGTHFLLAGNGQYLDNYQELARHLGIGDRVHFLDHRAHPDLVQLYSGADLLMVPSNFEAFGIVAAEAAATGLPVVASNVGGLPEVVTKDVGRIVPRGDPSALAGQIIDMLRNGAKELMGATAAVSVRARFSWERSGELFMKMVKDFIVSSADAP